MKHPPPKPPTNFWAENTNESITPMIDTHSHLDGEEFAEDLEDVLRRAQDASVEKIFVPGICLKDTPHLLEICNAHPGYLYPMIGLHPEEVRSAEQRGYGRAWQKARKKYLEVHPLCVECMKEGKYVKATDVDHIVPHRGDKILFWDESNWQPLCKPCHDKKTGDQDTRMSYAYKNK